MRILNAAKQYICKKKKEKEKKRKEILPPPLFSLCIYIDIFKSLEGEVTHTISYI
jgi:hypothetical protein